MPKGREPTILNGHVVPGLLSDYSASDNTGRSRFTHWEHIAACFAAGDQRVVYQYPSKRQGESGYSSFLAGWMQFLRSGNACDE
jgi:hypothetical protein